MKTKLWALAFAPLFFSACTNTVPTPYEQMTAHRKPTSQRDAVLPRGVDNVTIAGTLLPVATPGPVSFTDLHICEAAEVVFGQALSVNHTCTGDGVIGLEVAGGSGQVLLQTFVGAVRRSGGTVTMEGQTAHVVGGGRTALGISGQMPSGLPTGEQQTEGGVSFFTMEAIDRQIERKARDTVAQSPALMVQRFPGAQDPSPVQHLASELQLDVSATSYNGSVYAVGTPTDLAAISPFLEMAENAAVPFDVGHVPASTVEAITASYPEVTVSYDDQLGTLWLRGNLNDVYGAYHAVRARVPANRDLRIEAAFVSSSVQDAQKFDVDPVLAAASGDLRLASAGSVLGSGGFSAVVTHLNSYSSVNILSRPSVVTSSGREAEFISGSKLPIVGEIDEEGRQSVSYQDTGIVLRVLPTVLPSGLVRLNITVEISSAEGVGVLNNPNISTRSISTTVEASPGDVVKLSGLVDAENGGSRGRKLGLFPSLSGNKRNTTLSFFVMVDHD